jgi:hypothetical protein
MWSKRKKSGYRKADCGAYLLLDVVLAVTVFAIAVTGILTAVNRITETSKFYARDMQVQYGMDAMLVEARHRPVEEMAFERDDSDLGVLYRTEIEPLNQVNSEGEALEGLYQLKVSAKFQFGDEDETDTAEVIVYRPATETEGG